MESSNKLSRLLARPELPYILSALCLTLLIKHGYDSSSPSSENPSTLYPQVGQRSLQEVREKCYQERHVPLQAENCGGDCNETSEFAWSILTCGKTGGVDVSAEADDAMHDMAVEVIRAGKML